MKLLTTTIALMLFFAVTVQAQTNLQQADEAYARRAENFDAATMTVGTANINRAVELYTAAFDQSSGAAKQEACWKLIRACYFKGQYAETGSDAKKAIYDVGKNAGAAGLKEFPESVEINAWMAIIWGVWGEEYGILKSAREGVAGNIRDRCEKVIELDDTYYDATGYRVLGRLHFKAPKIPIILGWPSKEKAVEYLEKAYQIAPGNLNTKLYLAEALYDRKQRERAMTIMGEIVESDEAHQGIVEDAFIRKQAAEILAEWEK